MSLADPYGASSLTPRAGSAALGGPSAAGSSDGGAGDDDWLLSSDDEAPAASAGEGRNTPPAGKGELGRGEAKVPTMGEREWRRVEAKFEDAGYRDGITAGKAAALQGAFDVGFATVGAPLGRRLGQLRGRAAAQLSVLLLPSSSRVRPGGVRVQAEEAAQPEVLRELRALIAELARTKLEQLAPRDVEALRHAAEDEGRAPSEIRDETEQERREREGILDELEGRLEGVLARVKRPSR